MKYFFLSEGWHVGRVWEFGGLWNEASWRRKPEIRQLNLCISENGERLWLYSAEDAVLMLEVRPGAPSVTTVANRTIGQVVLKRLMTPEQVIDLICAADAIYRTFDHPSPEGQIHNKPNPNSEIHEQTSPTEQTLEQQAQPALERSETQIEK